jgi:hypothetical protein
MEKQQDKLIFAPISQSLQRAVNLVLSLSGTKF